jgi:hypothetical protein
LTKPGWHSDAGQAFPIYLTVVAGLLFLAFAYFAVGQATVNRSGAQTAADAAALAAAQNVRDQLAAEWVKDVTEPDKWQDIFHGTGQELQPWCWRAYELAQQNDAHVLGCGTSGPLAYTVDVRTNKSMGQSLVPITESKHSTAHATAVIKPLCTFEPLAADADPAELPRLTCGNRHWDLELEHLPDLPEPQDLFDVHLADR